MRVARARGVDGARGARGTVVVIDVLRAFTTAAYAFGSGARAVELVSTPEEGLARKAEDPALLLVGEVGGRPIPGFDHGNSPERMSALDLAGRTLVLRSSSGVQGALAAHASSAHLLLGSLVTASATARAVRALGYDATLVAMGSPEGPDGPEDEACAELLEGLLSGAPPDRERILEAVRASPAARAALDPEVDWITPGDLARALELDRFDFTIRAAMERGRLIARRTR
jgi:2-phosphosulfolactate phosphatase